MIARCEDEYMGYYRINKDWKELNVYVKDQDKQKGDEEHYI